MNNQAAIEPPESNGAFFLTANDSTDSDCNAPTLKDDAQSDGETADEKLDIEHHHNQHQQQQQQQQQESEEQEEHQQEQEEEKLDNDADEHEVSEASEEQVTDREQPEATENNDIQEETAADTHRASPDEPENKDEPPAEANILDKPEKKKPIKQRKKRRAATAGKKPVEQQSARAPPPKSTVQRRSRSAEPAPRASTRDRNKLQSNKKQDEKNTKEAKAKPAATRTERTKSNPPTNGAGKDKQTKTGRHVSFEEGRPFPRRRSKSAVTVTIPPVSNETKMLQKLTELQLLISRDYRDEARLCYKRGIVESGCTELLRRWALEFEAQRQQQQQQQHQQQAAGSPEASRRRILRPETSGNRLAPAAPTAAPVRSEKSRSSRHSQQKQRLPSVNA